MKNALNNYVFNLGNLVRPEVQNVLNQFRHKTAMRVKVYPYKDILSVIFDHTVMPTETL